MAAAACGGADRGTGQLAGPGQGGCQRRHGGPAIVDVAAQHAGIGPEPGRPFHGPGQGPGGPVVQNVQNVRGQPCDQVHAVGHAEMPGQVDAVRVAEEKVLR